MGGTLPIILVGLVSVGAAGMAVFYWRQRTAAPEEGVYHLNCPHCGRRLRYRTRQAGHRGACPRCRQAFHFPEVPGGEADD